MKAAKSDLHNQGHSALTHV